MSMSSAYGRLKGGKGKSGKVAKGKTVSPASKSKGAGKLAKGSGALAATPTGKGK